MHKPDRFPVLDSVLCRGFEVVVSWQSGSVDAFWNCKLDENGQCEGRLSILSGQTISAAKIKADEQWRSDSWKVKFEVVGQWLAQS